MPWAAPIRHLTAWFVGLPEMCRGVQFHFYDFGVNQDLATLLAGVSEKRLVNIFHFQGEVAGETEANAGLTLAMAARR